MIGSVKKFLKDRKGAFAMQFALMVVPLTVCTGLAIDGGRAFLARYELESALDAAALAVGSTYADSADLDDIAQKFVDINFHSAHAGPIALDLTPGEDVVKLKGNVTINTYFMPLVGQPTVTVSAESEVRRGGGNVEVALALDITQSMSGSKISALKTAAKDLVDEVVNDAQSPYFSRVALAPWGTNFHVGSLAPSLRGAAAGPTTITAAHWRSGSAKTITAASWSKGSAQTISKATWKNGSAVSVSVIANNPTTSPTRIRVTTSSNHGYTTGDFVRITGANGSFAFLNNNIYYVEVSSTTRYYLKNVANTAYIAPVTGTVTNGSAGSGQRCYSKTCEVAVVTSANHGFTTGDFIYVTGNGMSAVNKSANTTWTIGAASGTYFVLPGVAGPGVHDTDGSGGAASECYDATCDFTVTAASHGFANNDYIFITGANPTSGSGQINNSTGTTWQVSGVTTDTFFLPGPGMSYQAWTGGGTASECYDSACHPKITSASHGLNTNDWVQIAGVGGITGLNNSGTAAWQVYGTGSGYFYLSTWGPGVTNATTAYTSGGTAQCVVQGCQKYRFLDASGSTYQVKSISNCVTERTGPEAATDASPSTAPLGRDYAGAGSLVGCQTANNLIPLTSNKTLVKDAIDDMTVYGSTAGQIGAAWAWYLLSPNWNGVFTGADHEPSPYPTKQLAKVAVLMTDGEFNTAHCNGVTTETYAYSSVSNSDKIDSSVCTAANPAFGQPTAPFNQAMAICAGMKARGIIIYTVGFEVGGEAGAADFLNACATDASHAYLADDSAALSAAFKSIAKQISKLRISR